MKKKVVAMFLAAVMALSLVACGNKTDNGGSGDAADTAETIKLGGVGTLFGQDNANDAAGAESGDAADTAADAEA